MSSRILRKLDVTTLKTVANCQDKDEISGKARNTLTHAIAHDIEVAAAKYLVQSMKKAQLEAAVEFLDIDHGDNNPNNKMVLQKRLRESLIDTGIKQWFAGCQDHEVVKQIGKALGIRGFSTMGIRVLKKTIEEELDIIGTQIVFNALTLPVLRDCCVELEIENCEHATSKNPLIKAMTLGAVIPAPQKQKRRGTRKPKFVAIEDAESYDQLFQHYKLETLVAWCKDNGLKTSGTKKIVINRILAYHAGDKENTMADPTRVNRPRSTKQKKETKPAPPPTRVSARQQERAQQDEEMADAESESESESVNEQSESVSEQAVEEQVVEAPEESESVAMDLSSSEEDPDHPTNVEGLLIAIAGKTTTSKKELKALIERNGGTLHQGKTIKKDVNVVVTADVNNPKYSKVKKIGMRVVDESFFKNLQ